METKKNLFGKVREVISRHGQKRKEMDLVPRKGEDRKTDDRFYRHQSIVKKVLEAVANTTEASYNAELPMMLKDLKAKKKNSSDMRREYGSSYKKLCGHCSIEHGPNYTRQHMIDMAQKHMSMKEEAEQIDELSKDKLKSYTAAANKQIMDRKLPFKKEIDREKSVYKAQKKIMHKIWNEDINTSFKDFVK
jgi:hypothetical protein